MELRAGSVPGAPALHESAGRLPRPIRPDGDDNRCLLHKANGDYPVAEVRYLYRLMLKGERPV
jgi:hypothetical protein